MKIFRINNAYTIMPGKNMVNEVKLEPRLMKLLCLLAENPGKVISREEVIDNIWKGYGGGDEGLTQAISFLRKLLQDDEKKIIETVPKAGYIFNADVEWIEEEAEKRREKNRTRWPVYIIAGILLLGLLWLLLYPAKNEEPYAPKAPEGSNGQPAIAPKNE